MGTEKADEERITGTIKSIDEDIVTVVYKEPSGKRQEIDVSRKGIGKSPLAVGEVVTIEFSRLTVETKIPTMGSMLEIEDAIMDALGLMKEDLLKETQTKKKTSAKRARKA